MGYAKLYISLDIVPFHQIWDKSTVNWQTRSAALTSQVYFNSASLAPVERHTRTTLLTTS